MNFEIKKKRIKNIFSFVCTHIHKGSPMFCGWMQGFFILRVVCLLLTRTFSVPSWWSKLTHPPPMCFLNSACSCSSWHLQQKSSTCSIYYNMYDMPTVHLMLKLLDINNTILYISYLLQLTELATGNEHLVNVSETLSIYKQYLAFKCL